MSRRRAAVVDLPAADRRAVATLAVLRPEFRVDRFVPPPGHFLAPKRCAVPECPGERHAHGLYPLHRHAWDIAGRTDPARWGADPANATVGWAAPVQPCPVGGCPHAQGPFRLCENHRRRFTRMGITGASTGEYMATAPPVFIRADATPCGLAGCRFPVLGDGLCDGHQYRWTKLGRPPLAELPAVL